MGTALRNLRRQVLLVDPDRTALTKFGEILREVAYVEICSDFCSARKRLSECPPDRLVTAARLGAYNGLHLAYLTNADGLRTRTVVYSDTPDPIVAHEAQVMRAFYEIRGRLAKTIVAYVRSRLPDRDRRNPFRVVRPPAIAHDRRASDDLSVIVEPGVAVPEQRSVAPHLVLHRRGDGN